MKEYQFVHEGMKFRPPLLVVFLLSLNQ